MANLSTPVPRVEGAQQDQGAGQVAWYKVLAVKAKLLGRRIHDEIGTLVIPDILLAWHSKLIVKKWIYARKGAGRHRIAQEITDLVQRRRGRTDLYNS